MQHKVHEIKETRRECPKGSHFKFLEISLYLNTLYNKPIERLATVHGEVLLYVVLLKDITASNGKASAQYKATHTACCFNEKNRNSGN